MKNCNHLKLKYYNILEKFWQMHVWDMARPRGAHASKNDTLDQEVLEVWPPQKLGF